MKIHTKSWLMNVRKESLKLVISMIKSSKTWADNGGMYRITIMERKNYFGVYMHNKKGYGYTQHDIPFLTLANEIKSLVLSNPI